MTKKEFLSQIVNYYGDFQNMAVFSNFSRILKKIDDSDLEKLLDYFMSEIPCGFKIDVKSLMDACRKTCTNFIVIRKACPVCGFQSPEENNLCNHCGYDFSIDPETYKKSLASPEEVAKALNRIKYR